MNQRFWRDKVKRAQKKARYFEEKYEVLKAKLQDSGELDALRKEVDELKGELRAAKMREGKLKKQIEKKTK